MATTKKTTAKKTAVKSKPVAKKTTAKKTAAPKVEVMKSFRLSKNPAFVSLRITRQTVYWSVLLIFILILQIWILNMQLDIIDITESLSVQ